MSYSADRNARVDLLCFLVIGQLVARIKTGVWLQPDRTVELLLIWSMTSEQGQGNEHVDAAELGVLSELIAVTLLRVPDLHDLAALTKLFAAGETLDYRSDKVQALYRICAARLAKR